jgi:hypothetical protein
MNYIYKVEDINDEDLENMLNQYANVGWHVFKLWPHQVVSGKVKVIFERQIEDIQGGWTMGQLNDSNTTPIPYPTKIEYAKFTGSGSHLRSASK